MTDEPHIPKPNRIGSANAAPRCGARRRDGGSCRQPAMKNGRCRLHGGKSTGPITCEGLERSRKANWRHGHYSAKAKQERMRARAETSLLRKLLKQLRPGHG
jgi:hypothetical protein